MESNDLVTSAVSSIKDAKLKKSAENLLGLMTQVSEGLDDDMSFSPAFMRLVQPTTDPDTYPEGTQVGDFVVGSGAMAERMSKPLKFHMLMLHTGRSYFMPSEEGSDSQGRLICFSPDGQVGKLGRCKSCPYSQRVDDEISPCHSNRTAIGLTEDLDLIFQFVFAKTGYGESAKILKSLKGPRGLRSTFSMPWEITSAVYPQRKTVRIPVVSPVLEKISADVAAFLQELSRQIKLDREKYIAAFREQYDTGVSNAPALLAASTSAEGEAATASVEQELNFD